jgi:hypothetical protein
LHAILASSDNDYPYAAVDTLASIRGYFDSL